MRVYSQRLGTMRENMSIYLEKLSIILTNFFFKKTRSLVK